MKGYFDMSSIMPLHSIQHETRLRLYAVAFVISLLTSAFSGWQSWQLHMRNDDLSSKHIALTEDVGSIMLYDEVLTMSARMAAATGDFSYEKRYDEFDLKLTTEINEVRDILPQEDIAGFVEETDAANLALVKMERQAFALTHRGRGQEATALLVSTEYLRYKKVYADGMEKTVNAANALIERDNQHQHVLSVWTWIANAVGVLLLLAVWLLAIRSARRWAAERQQTENVLRKAHDELEVRVEQRTIELSDANQQLKQEIAEHALAEANIQRINRLYAVLSQCNQAIVRCNNQDELFPQICRDIVQFGGFKMAWIGIVDPDTQIISPAASFGERADEYLHDIEITANADSQFGRGPTGRAIHEDQPFWCQDFQHDPATAPWHERGARFGWGASAALPLHRDGVVIGAFTLYTSEANAFDEASRKLLLEMALDISYALSNFAREEKRKQAELQLLENEMQYRTLADSGSALIWASGIDMLGNYFNQPWLIFTGRTLAQELGNGWAQGVHPDDLLQCQPIYATAFDRREPFSREYRLHHRSGEYRWVQDDGCPRYNQKGEFIGYIGYCLDITERKQSEVKLLQLLDASKQSRQALLSVIEDKNLVENSLRKLSLAVEQSSSSIIITDLDANIEYANAAFFKATGYSRAEVIGQNPRLLHSDKNPNSKASYEDMWAHLTRGDVWKGELINRRKDGSEYTESVLISPVRQPDGQVTNYVAIKEDITEIKQAQLSLRQLNEELEAKIAARTVDLEHARHDAELANQAKSSFLANMSHEIRTPMNGVIGMIDVLQQSSLNSSQMEMANIIHDSAFSLLSIIDDILDFSKIEAGKLFVESVSMSVAEIVESACDSLSHLALKKGVALTLFTDPAIPAAVMGDPGRMRQVLINLANNALKFSSGLGRTGKVSVRATLIERTAERATLEFRVIDNGVGMDEATLARLFTAFTQGEASTTRTYGGTGLGLVISRQLVNIMGGEISVQSEPGVGSVFSVRMPFALPTELPDTYTSPALLAGLRCLIVGDAESMADDLLAYLTHAGAQVERVADPAAAKSWIAASQPGLCVITIDNAHNSLLEYLRTLARARQNMEVHFVVIGRGGRRQCRREAPDLVTLDGESMSQSAFLQAVSIASGRVKPPNWQVLPGDAQTILTPLSREEARRQGYLILVAEDNEINQKVILQQLRLLGKTAEIANNGSEALLRWQSGDYSILITDLHMPKMDGYELAASIRAAENVANKSAASVGNKVRIPIIAFTANALKGEDEHCRAVGMDGYLSKPVQLANLKAMLEKWLPTEVAPSLDEPALPSRSPHDNAENTPGFHAGNIAESAIAAPATVDVNVLKALVGEDEATIREFLHDFRLSAERIAVELRTACAADQATTAGALAHKLKSSARSVGALALGELCAEMEKTGKSGDSARLAVLLPQFEQELASVKRFLDGY